MTFNLYGLMIGLGVLAALRVSEWLADKRKVDKKLIEKAFWWVLVGGIVGARLYHVIDLWDKLYRSDPIQIIKVWNGGLGIWGAIIGGVTMLLGYYVIRLRKKMNLFNLLDVAFVGLPLGQAIGRLGNFFNQELYGRVTNLPWGIPVEGQLGKFHPLFAYEAISNLILFGVLVKLVRLDKFEKRSGLVTGIYLIGYGVIRFALEPLRPESIVWKIGGVPTASLISVLAVALGLVFIWRRRD